MPQFVNVLGVMSSSPAPKMSVSALMNCMSTTAVHATLMSSTCMVAMKISCPRLCFTRSWSSWVKDCALNKPFVAFASFKLKHLGASLKPVPGLSLCSTSRTGSKDSKPLIVRRTLTDSASRSKLTSRRGSPVSRAISSYVRPLRKALRISMAVSGQPLTHASLIVSFWARRLAVPLYVTRPSASRSLKPLSVRRILITLTVFVGSVALLTCFHLPTHFTSMMFVACLRGLREKHSCATHVFNSSWTAARTSAAFSVYSLAVNRSVSRSMTAFFTPLR